MKRLFFLAPMLLLFHACGDNEVQSVYLAVPAEQPVKSLAVEFDAFVSAEPGSTSEYILEVQDGGRWKSAGDECLTLPDGEKYSFSLVPSAKKYEEHTAFYQTFLLKNEPQDSIRVRIRMIEDDDAAERDSMTLELTSKLAAPILRVLPPVKQKDTTKVLCIGNSFTYCFNAPSKLKELAWSQGHYLDLRAHLRGGQTFGQQLGLQGTAERIAQGPYDYVFLQDQSQNPARLAKDHNAYADVLLNCIDLAAKVREYSPKARLVMEHTWGYPGNEAGGFGSLEIFDSLLYAGSLEMAKSIDAKLSLIGIAFATVRNERPDISLYDKDDKHQSAYGAYLKACVNYQVIFNEPFTEEASDCGLDPEKTKYLRAVAQRYL